MFWPFLIIGLVSGSIYGLAAVGLVVTYKTSGVFNFAHGALAAVAAYVFYTLHVSHDMSWPLAAIITVFGVGTVLAFALELIARALAPASIALRVSCTVGLLLIINASLELIYGNQQTRTVPVFLGEGTFNVGSTVITFAQLATFLIAVGLTALLYMFFKFARSGMAMRAVVERPDLLEISGTNAATVRRGAWLIGTYLVTASGVLLSTLLPLDVTQLTLLVVNALGAAALGAFTSLPIVFGGGLALGIGSALATKYFTTGFLSGVPVSIPFIILLLVLLIFPKKYLRERSFAAPLQRSNWTMPTTIQLPFALAVLAALALVPTFAGIHLTDWTVALANIILFLSLGLLVRSAGQVSLGHITFVAIGAATFSRLAVDSGLPWLVAFVLACLIAMPIGALLAIPAIRLSPLYLALATFGFGIFVQYMFYNENYMFGSTGAGISVPRPHLWDLDTDRGYYYIVLGFVVLASLAVLIIDRSRFGRLLRAMADAPLAVSTNGVSTQVTWILVFGLSAALAAASGVLSGGALQTVSASGYPPLESLTYLALVVIAIGSTPWYAIVAGLALTVIPSYVGGPDTSTWLQLLFGVAAVLYTVTPDSKRGAPPVVQRLFGRDPRAQAQRRRERSLGVGDAPVGGRELQLRGVDLDIQSLTVRFGGLVAVNEVSLAAPLGRITGVIGPNGAGKSTIFNACSGLVTPTSGQILLGAKPITRLSRARRARRGLGRTFQQMELFETLTVWENVTTATEGATVGPNPLRHLIGRRGDRKRIAASAVRAIELCGLEDVLDTRAADLSTGQRRLVELARCIAGPFEMLLLDEPASGLDHGETLRFGEILRRLVAERGVGILLVEHDMSLVMSCCEYIYVVDFGNLIFSGTPNEVVKDPLVRAAYLGDENSELDGLAMASGDV